MLLCPIYAAGEKKNSLTQDKLAKDIIKNSKKNVIIVKSAKDIELFLNNNLKANEIVIGMGAGNISSWMKNISKNYQKHGSTS